MSDGDNKSDDPDAQKAANDYAPDPATHSRSMVHLAPLFNTPYCRKQILRQQERRNDSCMPCKRQIVDLYCGSKPMVPQSVFPSNQR